jgi:MIP family channel proteins
MSVLVLEKERELLWDRRPYMAEFCGTFFFVAIGILSLVGSAALGLLNDGSTRLVVAAANGGAIAWMVFQYGAVSGAHFNPAVTFAVFLRKEIGFLRGVFYIGAQLAGVLLAVFLLREFVVNDIIASGSEVSADIAALKLGTPTFAENLLSMKSWFFLEVVLTALLVSVILRTAFEQKFAPWAAGLAIGGTVFIDVLAGGPFTGAAMNPARAFGPAAVSGYWTNHWIYWAAPLTGAFIGWLVNEVTSRKIDR